MSPQPIHDRVNSYSQKTENTSSLPWLVVYTKPRQEKKLAERLAVQGYEVYCPTRKVRRQWSDRVKVVEEALFTSHLFIRIAPNKREDIVYTPGFVRYLFWLKKPAQVREDEIMTLKKWLGEYDHESLSIEPFLPGQKLKIHSGPFQGLDAELIKQQGKHLELVLTDMQLVIKVDSSHAELSRA